MINDGRHKPVYFVFAQPARVIEGTFEIGVKPSRRVGMRKSFTVCSDPTRRSRCVNAV